MNINNKEILRFVTRPGVAIPAAMAASAGSSIYGNLLNENELEKGDNRLITESLLSGLGAGAGLGLGFKLRKNPTARRMAGEAIDSADLPPKAESTLRMLLPYLVGSGLASFGASVGSGPVASTISGQAHLMGLPSFSGRQQDFYEEDKKSAIDELTSKDIELLKQLINSQ